MRSLLVAVTIVSTCSPVAPPPADPKPPAPAAAEKADYTAAVALLATAADLEQMKADSTANMRSLPASRSFSNVLLMQDTEGEKFLASMYGMQRALDRKCLFCHEKDDFSKDTNSHKAIARQMLLLTERLNRETFGGEVEVTCWTCHRGAPEPEKMPADFAARVAKAIPQGFAVPEADAKKPAREVFKNLQVLGHVPAEMIPQIMGAFSASLGEDCSMCHVKDDPASDDKKYKKLAREMMKMSGSASAQIEGTSGAVTCWMCHRGAEHPEKMPGEPKHEH